MTPQKRNRARIARRVDLRTCFFTHKRLGLGGKDGQGRPAAGRKGSIIRKTLLTPGAEGDLLATSGQIGRVDVRMYARKPRAYIEPLHQLPKAGRQDIDNASVRVPAYEGCQAVIVTQVNPASSPLEGSSMAIKEANQCQQLQSVYQSSVAKEIRPYSGGAGGASGVQVRGRAAPVK